MFQKRRKKKTNHTFCDQNFFSPKNRSVYEIMRKHTVEPDSPQMTIQYGACAVHAGYQRLQTHTQSM